MQREAKRVAELAHAAVMAAAAGGHDTGEFPALASRPVPADTGGDNGAVPVQRRGGAGQP